MYAADKLRRAHIDRAQDQRRTSCGATHAAIENVALCHERDVSHSAAERVILPGSTILLDCMQSLAVRVVKRMVVHEDRMLENLGLTLGACFAAGPARARVVGATRDDAYRVGRRLNQRA